MAELVAATRLISQGALVAPGDTLELDDDAAATLVAEGSATVAVSKRRAKTTPVGTEQ